MYWEILIIERELGAHTRDPQAQELKEEVAFVFFFSEAWEIGKRTY
jgi:hypothetical protein